MGSSHYWRYSFHRLTVKLVWLTILGLLLSANAAAQDGKEEKQTTLLPSRLMFFRLPQSGSLSVKIASAEGKYSEILIESSAPGIEFNVLAQDGRVLQTASPKYSGWLAISFSPAPREEFCLTARARSPQADLSGAGFRAELLHFSAREAVTRSNSEAIFNSAQALSHSQKAVGLREAIDAYKKAGASWAFAGLREGRILALAGEARSWLGLSDHDKAIAALNRASDAAVGMRYWQAWLADLRAQVFLDRWEIGPSRRNAEDALHMSFGLDDSWITADALADRGESEYLTHDPAAPVDISQALRLARDVGAISTIARALRCNAWMEKDEGHLSHAVSLLDRARDYFHRDGDIRPELQAMATIAQIENTSGEIYSTLLRHSKLAALMRDTGYAAHYGILLEDIGRDYEGLNRVPDAIVYYHQALAIYKTIHYASGEAAALLFLSAAEIKENHLTESLRDCTEAASIVQRFHDPWRLGNAKWHLGTVQRALGQTALAINSFRLATELSKDSRNLIGEARSLMDWGDALESLGKRDEARALFETALPLTEAAGTKPLQLEVRYRIAHSEFESGRDDDAKQELKIAMTSFASLRRTVSNSDLQASYFGQLRKCHDLLVDILMKEQERDPQSGGAAQALEISDSGRALTLLDAVAARDAEPADARQSIGSQEIEELHLAVERAYDQRLKLMIEGARTRELETNAATLTQAIDALERTEDEQKATAGSLGFGGQTLTSSEFAVASKGSNSTLVEYSLATEKSYVWVIEGGKIESHILPARDRIESAVERWRRLATARTPRPGESPAGHIRRINAADRELPRLAADLSCMLLAPFLRTDMKHLVIVPDGKLHLLPFAALPENGCLRGEEPLVVRHQVVLTPSLSVLLTAHERTRYATFRGEVALLADPVFDRDDSRVHRASDLTEGTSRPPFAPALPRLIGTRKEAKAIAALVGPERAALYLDFNASLQTLLSPSLDTYRILHLASHGILDERMPSFSGIVLSLVDQAGQPVFGYLKAHDIASLDLKSDLVVLSSCDSGAGIDLSSEGVSGLNHAFLSAGAKRVVSSLWSVDDETSSDLMIAFYSRMLEDGLEPSEALQSSQVQIMSNPHTAAPYYWAAFTITSRIY